MASNNPTLTIKGSRYPLTVNHHLQGDWQIKTSIRVEFIRNQGGLHPPRKRPGVSSTNQMASIHPPEGAGRIVLSASDFGYDNALGLLMREIKIAIKEGKLVYRDDDVKEMFKI